MTARLDLADLQKVAKQSTGVGNVRSEYRMQPRARMGTIEKQGDDGGRDAGAPWSRAGCRADQRCLCGAIVLPPKFVQGDETLGRTRKAPWGGAGQRGYVAPGCGASCE